jgi:inosine-uridine nucleoside N-ribohydrolase
VPRPLLLDVDTGVDDAMALALAARLDDHRLVAVTTVAGNVPVDVATINTQRVLSWLSVDVPIHRGMSAPLARPLHTAREHHGHDGLGGWAIPAEPAKLASASAPEAIIQLASRHRGEITFAFVGPLTNLAVALMLEPRVVDWVPRLVIMGGAFFVPGNTTADAEFNIFADPEAAARVSRSGMRATWVPLDVTHQTGLTRDAWERLAEAIDPGVVLVREVTRRTLTELKRPRSYLHDPLAVAVVEQPDVVGTATGTVVVDTGETMRGRTRLAAAVGSEIAVQVATDVDQSAFSRLFGTLA